jgi:hypothetical protein
VTFGLRLWVWFGEDMTYGEFKNSLSTVLTSVARHAPDPQPVIEEYARHWPYPLGYFDNQDRVFRPEPSL